jgi:hypothetical protein
MLDAMFSARRPACCLMVWAAGCLAAPPAADEDQAVGDCEPILEDRFDDDGLWVATDTDPGSGVTRAPDAVWITSAPTDGDGDAYADLHSKAVAPIADTVLTAALLVGGDAVGGDAVGGISWDHADNGEDDYFDFVVDAGSLLAVRKEADGEHREICSSGCPQYDPELHASLRLRAAGDEVLYEVSPGGAAWREIARAPIAAGAYRAVAFTWAAAPDESDLEVNGMAWTTCER